MLAGAKYRGEFEDRLQGRLERDRRLAGQVILFIDELHTIVGAGASEGAESDASNMLKPASWHREEIAAIRDTTLNEYRKYIEKTPSNAVPDVFVGEPNVEDTIAILRGLKSATRCITEVRITVRHRGRGRTLSTVLHFIGRFCRTSHRPGG